MLLKAPVALNENFSLDFVEWLKIKSIHRQTGILKAIPIIIIDLLRLYLEGVVEPFFQ